MGFLPIFFVNMKNQFVGQQGEDGAVNYLIKKGYKILSRNLRFGHKEIDIVAQLGKKLVFVEVKSRTSSVMGDGSEELEGDKARKFSRAVELYLDFNNYKGDFRLDLITIMFDAYGNILKLEHLEDII